MSKTVTLKLDDGLYRMFNDYAQKDNRTLSNFIKTATRFYIEDKMLVDEFEMDEIRNNHDLVDRIRAGSQDAANRVGRFVE